jgi:putative ATPase
MNASRDLFSATSGPSIVPLAERLRPKTIEEVVGQKHLLGEGKPLSLAFRSGKPHSMILWGPPGVGKTTLARLMADAFNAEFIAISAVLAGVKEIRESVERSKLTLEQYGRHTILFVDEVHRFNKAQQDAFLPYVEQGLFTFIGATTENPSFEVNSALLSRAQVYVLQSLSATELDQLIVRGFAAEDEVFDLTEEARKRLAELSDGDGRRALNLVEQVYSAARLEGRRGADVGYVNAVVTRSARRFDKGGEEFYNQISAMHKAVRGSDPDASLYWLVRMLDGGSDPRYLARRMIRMASEDVGLADPRALPLAVAAHHAVDFIGLPEAELTLAHVTLFIATAPKSNSATLALGAAHAALKEQPVQKIPSALRSKSGQANKRIGQGKDYRYAHDWPEAIAPQTYLEKPLALYTPKAAGAEAAIAERLERWKKLRADFPRGGANSVSAT